MKTAIHNTQNNTTEIRDIPKWQPLNEHQILLQVIRNDSPIVNPATHRAEDTWTVDLTTLTYTQTWAEIPLTEQEQINYVNQQALQAEENRREIARQRATDNEIEVINAEVVQMDDEQAVQNPTLFKQYNPNNYPYKLINPDTDKPDRFYYPLDGKLYDVVQDHTSAIHFKPGEAVSLYSEVQFLAPGNLCETAPEWFSQVWNGGAFVKDDNTIWQAKDNNTFTWVKPAHSGDGSISWEWVKDCD